MKSFLKVFVLVCLMIISRLDKQEWQINGKPLKASIASGLTKNANLFLKSNTGPTPQISFN